MNLDKLLDLRVFINEEVVKMIQLAASATSVEEITAVRDESVVLIDLSAKLGRAIIEAQQP